ncbi:two-component system response regulator [Geotalea uraniireducens]|uniref:Two-component system response regulator n=1 Tax=Geotalea uraniireducens TaxID=351604 RepID=A0ABM8EG12_9BACT|nr:response regulator [Geotalea uraniireducens]BDV41344.1 two-component system response regulator [Geotalea uraniireducens]
MDDPRILLVDDEKFFLAVACEYLKDSQIRALTATSASEGLRIARIERPHLIYLDYRMPEGDGAAWCREFKRDPALHDTPLIMVVGEGKDDDRHACELAGCNGVITKPLDRRQFLESGRRFLPAIDRRTPRIPLQAVAVFRQGGASHYGTVEELSTSGIFLSSRCNIEVGEQLRLGFVLPDGHLVEVFGRVAWLNRGARRIKRSLPEGFGLEFIHLSEEDHLRIGTLIDGATGTSLSAPAEGAS